MKINERWEDKENENFRRFNYRSEEKVYKEFMLYEMGRNIMKYHRFLQHENEAGDVVENTADDVGQIAENTKGAALMQAADFAD